MFGRKKDKRINQVEAVLRKWKEDQHPIASAEIQALINDIEIAIQRPNHPYLRQFQD